MGDAIARFRDMAITIRRVCDERHSQPQGRVVKPSAATKFAKECREHFLRYVEAGMNCPKEYVGGLCSLRNEVERQSDPAPRGGVTYLTYIAWLPDTLAQKQPDNTEMRKAVREAVKEAVKWGSLFPVVESRIKALDKAAKLLTSFAAPHCYTNPSDQYWEECDDGETRCFGPSKMQADHDYSLRHDEFAEALDALAPFVEGPPEAAGSSPGRQAGETKRAGRKPSNEELARDLLDGWRAYKPAEGRRRKDDYLAQRHDVQALRDPVAKQRKIASLRVTLESALHLRREKKKQRLRG
jgi:hypothetical protein